VFFLFLKSDAHAALSCKLHGELIDASRSWSRTVTSPGGVPVIEFGPDELAISAVYDDDERRSMV
jgi:hypothetical protein